MENLIHVGCCGFFKAQKIYYQTFDLIEIQSSFYKLPKTMTAERWRVEAPKNFTFTLKAWQLITHPPFLPTYRRSGLNLDEMDWSHYGFFRPTDEVFQAWEKTREIAQILQAPVVVFQCPPQFTPTQENVQNMHAFFQAAERDNMLFAWEPRGEWPHDLVKELCRDLNLLHCVDPFVGVSLYGTPNYYRMHGGADYDYKFKDADLLQLKTLCSEHPETYCLFNNVYMWEDALRFKDLLAAPGSQVFLPNF